MCGGMAVEGRALTDPSSVPRVAAGDEVTVNVRAIAAGGAGVADLPDGRVVFVPLTVPGDQVRLTGEIVLFRRGLCKVTATALVGDEVAAEANLTFVFAR